MKPLDKTASIEAVQATFRNAESLENAGRHAQALLIYQQITKSKPRWPYAYFGIGSAYAGMGKFEDARKNIRKAIALKNDHAAFHAKLADVLSQLDNPQEAIQAIDRAIELDPKNIVYRVNKAMIVRFSGDLQGAYDLLVPFIEADQTADQLVRVYASLCGALGEPERGIASLEPLTRTVHSDPIVTATHFFVLAKLYDQTGQFGLAYQAAARGSELRGDSYIPADREALLDQRRGAWSKDRIGTLARSRVMSDRPVFIVGMPRSGTTLIEQIIAAHPQAYGAGELINIFAAADEVASVTPEQSDLRVIIDALKPATLDRVARRILREMDKQAPKGTKPIRITDKLPLNFQHLGFIEQLFPNAQIIHCTRHPLDTFVSCYLLDFVGVNAHAYTYDPEHFAHFYSVYLRYMEHWKSVCSIPIFDVSYEETIADQRGVTERILSFLGLEWDDSCLRFFEAKRSVSTASTEQVRRPMYASSVGRWKNYKEQLGTVVDAMDRYGIVV